MNSTTGSLNFIEQIIESDIDKGLDTKALRFRFPPEPNGFLHIGHLKAICLNFELGKKYGAPVNLRFDDTNPNQAGMVFVQAIKKDIGWLGYKWQKTCYASDYFPQLYQWAHLLIEKGLAYVDSQPAATILAQKGTPNKPGTPSPFRKRSIDENKTLFTRMKMGEFAEGAHVLRAKIDMSSNNMIMRDPVIYRIIHKAHYRTGNQWSIYPLYDWTHGQSDYIEKVSHSLCSLEFMPHRALYDWFLDALALPKSSRPKQLEFSRLNLSHTITSKRKLSLLVQKSFVSGWDDPRMPTISGLRRRGYPAESLITFAQKAGVSKRENLIDDSLLTFCARETLNSKAPRVMVVINPIKLTILNYPESKTEQLTGDINPEQPHLEKKTIVFSKHLYIEKEDFKEIAEPGFFRLSIGREVRLKNAYIIKAERVIKNKEGKITEILATYDPETKSGKKSRKVKATLHWVSVGHAIEIKINHYDNLFNDKMPDKGDTDFTLNININSLQQSIAFADPILRNAMPQEAYQFQRLGYFAADRQTTKSYPVFNKIVTLRDHRKKTK